MRTIKRSSQFKTDFKKAKADPRYASGSLKDSAIFGRDGVILQREMRDEW
jgi:mRNA-degrading endonuclease YafQ of YafQ-DinJ toxin-antitoxin module